MIKLHRRDTERITMMLNSEVLEANLFLFNLPSLNAQVGLRKQYSPEKKNNNRKHTKWLQTRNVFAVVSAGIFFSIL